MQPALGDPGAGVVDDRRWRAALAVAQAIPDEGVMAIVPGPTAHRLRRAARRAESERWTALTVAFGYEKDNPVALFTSEQNMQHVAGILRDEMNARGITVDENRAVLSMIPAGELRQP